MQPPHYGHPPPPGQPPHGQPPHGYPPQPPPGYGPGAPPPPGVHPHQHYGHAPYGAPAVDPRLTELNNQAQTWLIVAIAGFWFGAGWITGPLAWIYGGRARDGYRALGLPPSGTATAAWAIGIATTLISVLAVLTLMIVLFAVIGVATQL